MRLYIIMRINCFIRCNNISTVFFIKIPNNFTNKKEVIIARELKYIRWTNIYTAKYRKCAEIYVKSCKINAHNQSSLEHSKLSCYLQTYLISLLVLINPFKENNRCDYPSTLYKLLPPIILQ